MRTLIFITMLVATISFSACGQKKNIPSKVKTEFAKKFPNAKGASWGKETSKDWEVEFKLNGKAYSANFTNTGEWKETEYGIKISEIPLAVKQTLDNEYKDFKIKEAEISETKDGNVYEFMIEKGDTKMEVAINISGKVVSKEVKNEPDEEDND